jgi:hypothetical protein
VDLFPELSVTMVSVRPLMARIVIIALKIAMALQMENLVTVIVAAIILLVLIQNVPFAQQSQLSKETTVAAIALATVLLRPSAIAMTVLFPRLRFSLLLLHRL